MSAARRAALLHRTRVGAAIAVAVGLVLWFAAHERGGPALVLVAGAALALAALVEARRMGTLRSAGELGGAAAAVGASALTLWAGATPGSPLSVEGLAPAAAHWRTLGQAGLAGVLTGGLGALAAPAAGGARRLARHLLHVVWLALPLPALFLVRQALGIEGLVALVLLAKIGDTAGYYSGQLLGRRFPHHPFPRLSPGKTTVGCWGSFVAGTLAGGALGAAGWLGEPRLGAASGLLAGALVNLAAQAGDLLESAAKRAAGVKDSGTLFGPSGGWLDLLDSLLLAVPAALVSWPWLFHWSA